MNSKHKLDYAHWKRFGPYHYRYSMTRDMREVYYLVIKGKQFPVAGAVFDALCKDGLIIEEGK